MNIEEYENLRLVEKCAHIIEPFDESLYDICKTTYPEFTDKIEQLFTALNAKIADSKAEFFERAKNEMKNSTLELISLERVAKVFSEPLYVRNHMFSVKTDIINASGVTQSLDLHSLSVKTKGAFYCKRLTPSMVLFSEHGFCCAILTKRGNINLVGGYTETEVKYTLCNFMVIIQESIDNIYPGYKMKIRGIELHNQAVSTTIPACKIDIYNCTTLAEHHNISFIYVPDSDDVLAIKPLPLTRPSIFVRIFPSGGIFCFGVRAIYEINVAMAVVASIIEKYIRRPPCSDPELEYANWKSNKLKKWTRLNENRIRGRQRSIAGWNQTVHNNNIDRILDSVKLDVAAEALNVPAEHSQDDLALEAQSPPHGVPADEDF